MFNQLRHSCAKLTESRIRHTTELITGIELIKMSTLETVFATIIGEARKQAQNISAINLFFFF